MKNIDDEVEGTLNSLQGLSRAQVSDDFSDQIAQKLSFLPAHDGWLRWLRYGVAAMLVLGAINILALFNTMGSGTADDLSTEVAEEFYDGSTYFFESTY